MYHCLFNLYDIKNYKTTLGLYKTVYFFRCLQNSVMTVYVMHGKRSKIPLFLAQEMSEQWDSQNGS